MSDLAAAIDTSGRFIYTHQNLCVVNATGRRIESASYRIDGAAIIDVEVKFVKIFPPPDEIVDKLENYFSEYAVQKSVLEIAEAHCNFLAIHPFPNGNGRTARFIADVNLAALGYSPFLNNRIDRTQYYQSMRRYFEVGDSDGIKNLIEKHLFFDGAPL